jgi:protein-S-isoprenylcysteine O-methyltransferase Ste14
MSQVLFLVILFCEALLVGLLGLSILATGKRVWPPPNGNCWQIYVVWTPIIVAFLSTVWLGLMDWNTFILGHWGRFVAGPIFMAGGYAIYYWARRHLGWKAMMGLREKFVPTGAYRYTRNPMYVGDIALCIGFGLVCNSLFVYIVSMFGILLFILTPFVEEPWLRIQYGKEYDEYLVKVRRFIPPISSHASREA